MHTDKYTNIQTEVDMRKKEIALHLQKRYNKGKMFNKMPVQGPNVTNNSLKIIDLIISKNRINKISRKFCVQKLPSSRKMQKYQSMELQIQWMSETAQLFRNLQSETN